MIVKRYYMTDFLKLFALAGIGLSISLSIIDLLDVLDDVLPFAPPAWKLLLYAVYHMPKNIIYLMPAGVLLSCLYTIGRASRTNELVAVMAAGGSLKRLFMPFIAVGVMLAIVSFALSEWVAPASLADAKTLKRAIMKKPAARSFYREGVMWFRAKDGSIVNIKLYVPDKNSFRGMSVFRFDGDGPSEIIQADEAFFGADGWTLKGVRAYDTATGQIETMPEFLQYPLGPPDALKEETRGTEEMGMLELRRYLGRLKEAGFKNLRIEVEMNSKVSFPVINIIMALLGVALASRRQMGGLTATATGLIISMLYYFGYTTMLSQGYAGVIPSLMAVWAMPLIFGLAALYLYARIPE